MWQQGYQPAVAPAAFPVAAPTPSGPVPSFKRQRPEYFGMPSGQENGACLEKMSQSSSPIYGHHLNNKIPYAGANQSAMPLGGMVGHPMHNNHMMGTTGLDNRNIGATRTNATSPRDASSTLYVEGLPSNCTKREVSHIFRPFSGFREVRLVNKESRHAGRYNLLCFVDFATPSEARSALETLQGYKFDEHDHQSSNLRIELSLSRTRPIGGPRGRK
uniref:RRM domain-containing protein n=2 Tax=Oryza brachyantha TaxID=4533 RepID=J3MZE4_ORYBR